MILICVFIDSVTYLRQMKEEEQESRGENNCDKFLLLFSGIEL